MRNLTIMFAAVLLLASCHSRQNEAIVKKYIEKQMEEYRNNHRRFAASSAL